MSIKLQTQVTGLQQELTAANEFISEQRSQGKTFKASTKVYHASEPARLSTETGMQLLKQGFASIRDKLASAQNS
mgnify:FL=1